MNSLQAQRARRMSWRNSRCAHVEFLGEAYVCNCTSSTNNTQQRMPMTWRIQITDFGVSFRQFSTEFVVALLQLYGTGSWRRGCVSMSGRHATLDEKAASSC
eukprot:scaffold141569_cov32-Prasinocladus_malaysianus.AAC.1